MYMQNSKIYEIYSSPEDLLYFDKITEKYPQILLRLYRTKSISKKQIEKSRHRFLDSAEKAFRYAKEVIKRRFPEGEKAIITNAKFSYLYALDIIHRRFPEGEEAMFGNHIELHNKSSFNEYIEKFILPLYLKNKNMEIKNQYIKSVLELLIQNK